MFCAPLILAESHSLANQFLVCYPANRRALKFHFNPFVRHKYSDIYEYPL